MGFVSSPISYPTIEIPSHQAIITWTIVFVVNISKLMLFLYVMFHVYLYNILGFVRVVVILSIHLSCHPSSSVSSSVHPSSSSRKKKMMEREEDDDSWWRDLIVQHVRTQSLASVIFAKSIQTFGVISEGPRCVQDLTCFLQILLSFM
jgi:hypothetical protein